MTTPLPQYQTTRFPFVQGATLSPASGLGNVYQIIDCPDDLSGSYGIVVKAQKVGDTSLLAIKMARKTRGSIDRAFSREIDTHDALASKDIPLRVPLLDRGVIIIPTGELCPFLVFPWAGQDLYYYSEKNPDLPLRTALRITSILLTHLMALHALNWVHGDVKLENFTIQEEGDPSDPAAFGAVDLSAFSEGECLPSRGTAEYSDPCVLLGFPASSHEDIWSLGNLLFNLATRKPILFSHDPSTHKDVHPSLFYLHQIQNVMGSKLVSEKDLSEAPYRRFFVTQVDGKPTLKEISSLPSLSSYKERFRRDAKDEELTEKAIVVLGQMFAPRKRRPAAGALRDAIEADLSTVERPLRESPESTGSAASGAGGSPLRRQSTG